MWRRLVQFVIAVQDESVRLLRFNVLLLLLVSRGTLEGLPFEILDPDLVTAMRQESNATEASYSHGEEDEQGKMIETDQTWTHFGEIRVKTTWMWTATSH